VPHARRYCRCGTLLARDYAASLCSLCQGKRRRDRAPEVPPEFWHTDVMAAALDSGDLGRVLRAYRFHPFHGQPLPQCIVAGWLHVSQATLSRIESGHRRLTVDEIAGFARALGHTVAVRWAPLHDTGEDVDPLSRRSLIGAGVGAALGLNATTAPAAAREIDPELVSHWRRLLRVLGRHDAMFGPHEVLDSVRREIDLIAQHRRVARSALQIQLLSVESRWAWLASWLSNDSGDWHRRDLWADRSLQLARQASDPDMVAWALVWQSRWAAMRQDARGAIALAEAAQRTPGAADKIRGLGALKEAHGHAVAGDIVACERRLADAHGRLDDDDPMTLSDDLGRRDDSAAPYVPADEARCWLVLRPQKAVAMLEGALRAWPRDRTRGLGVQQARLALACAADDLDRAAAEGIRALDMARTTGSDMTMRELKRLDHRIAACDTPAAADFREAFAAL
jgi:transcriptional regulator with XRE-family HTH domain